MNLGRDRERAYTKEVEGSIECGWQLYDGVQIPDQRLTRNVVILVSWYSPNWEQRLQIAAGGEAVHRRNHFRQFSPRLGCDPSRYPAGF